MKSKVALSKLRLCLGALLFQLVFCLQAQSQNLEPLLKQFANYQEATLQEKVFLHLDKTQYAASETLWAKAYLVAGPMHLPSGISKNLYMELVDEASDIKQRLILQTTEGLATASLPLDSALVTGDYYLRAYTNWMKNFDQDFFFKKKIRIINPNEAVTSQAVEETYPLQLKFYPEGGHLVKNIASKMAFEVTANPGDYKDHSGTIYNENDEAVASFSTSHENRGKLKFIPKSQGYYALLDGHEQRFVLPEVQPEGAVMLVNNKEADELLVTVKASESAAQAYYVVAHTRGIITHASKVELRGNRGLVRIEKSALQPGISHLTLMSLELNPLAERLAFIPNTQGTSVSVKTDKDGYRPRFPVTVEVEVKDAKGKPVEGSFSLSASHQAFTANDQTSYHIEANLLLSSDLKGYIHNPGQYFDNAPQAAANLDLLMMVKGWSRFSWDQIKAGGFNPEYLPEQGLNVSGRLVRVGKDKIKKGNLFIMSEGRSLLTSLEEDGRFTVENVNQTDTTEILIQGTQKLGFKNVTLELDTAFERLPLIVNPTKSFRPSPAKVEAFKEQYRSFVTVKNLFEQRSGYTDLGEVTVTAQKEGLRDGRIVGISSVLDYSDIPMEEKSSKDALQLMLGRVVGFTFAPFNPNAEDGEVPGRAPRMGAGGRWLSASPTIMINGREATAQEVWGLDPHAIDYVVTTRNFPGLISVYLKCAEEFARTAPRPGLYVTKLPGYHTPEAFYAPRYDGRNPFADLADNRITLYWEPMLTTDADGKATITFFTSDQEGQVIIDVQGISKSGETAVGNTSFMIGSDL